VVKENPMSRYYKTLHLPSFFTHIFLYSDLYNPTFILREIMEVIKIMYVVE